MFRSAEMKLQKLSKFLYFSDNSLREYVFVFKNSSLLEIQNELAILPCSSFKIFFRKGYLTLETVKNIIYIWAYVYEYICTHVYIHKLELQLHKISVMKLILNAKSYFELTAV